LAARVIAPVHQRVRETLAGFAALLVEMSERLRVALDQRLHKVLDDIVAGHMLERVRCLEELRDRAFDF
jgi:hypothetical protein